MTDASLRVLDYLGHFRQAIERIMRYTQGMDEQAFLGSNLVQDAVLRNIEILGEAANNIQKRDPAFAKEHEDLRWSVIYAMRNRVSHAYHTVDLAVVWNTVQNDLPAMQRKVETLLTKLTGRD